MSPQTRSVPRGAAKLEDVRDQEVMRANKELAAYFKGQRTEREARAALKIIRAFVKDRERLDPAKRRPLPGLEPAPAAVAGEKKPRGRKKADARPKAGRRRARRPPAAVSPSMSDLAPEPTEGEP